MRLKKRHDEMVAKRRVLLTFSRVVMADSGELPFGVSVKKEDASYFIPPILFEK